LDSIIGSTLLQSIRYSRHRASNLGGRAPAPGYRFNHWTQLLLVQQWFNRNVIRGTLPATWAARRQLPDTDSTLDAIIGSALVQLICYSRHPASNLDGQAPAPGYRLNIGFSPDTVLWEVPPAYMSPEYTAMGERCHSNMLVK